MAGFMVWRLVKQSEKNDSNALARENRMAARLDAGHDALLVIAEKAVKAQNEQSKAIMELARTLNVRPCMLQRESGKHPVEEVQQEVGLNPG